MESISDYDDYSVEYDDVGEDLDRNVEYYDEDVPFRDGITIPELYEECAKPSLTSAAEQICLLFISCLIFKILTQLLPIREPLCHIISVLCGVFGIFSLIGPTSFYTCVLALLTYWAVLICYKGIFQERTYKIVMLTFFMYLICREYYQILPEPWEQIRGIQMIIVLKSLSVCYEVTKKSRSMPPFLDYIGYIFCPATIVFGPWIPISMYSKVYENKPWSFGWVVKVFATTIFSFMCLGISSCWVYWLFLGVRSSWILAIRDAISVRFSHYFIAYLSEATCVLSGFYGPHDSQINVEVTNPLKIELPRSLVEVVVFWNIPMHRWLKTHVFQAADSFGPIWKIILTFFVSSLLHGLNFNLSMVLLSLGFYTYVEHTLRDKLASIFDACIRSRKCSSSCHHTFKSSHYAVFIVNFLFSCLAYFHLAYLGVMMAKKGDAEINILRDGFSQSLKSWSRLGYSSHWIVFCTYLFSIII